MTRTIWRERTFDKRTAAMLAEVDRLVGPNIPIHPTQGSYSSGEFSAGTHKGGGAVDLSVINPRRLTTAEINKIVRAMREVGFAAWYRTKPEWSGDRHIHGIAVGCLDLHKDAAAQVRSLREGRNGLVNNLKDRHAAMKMPVTTWEMYVAERDEPDPAPRKRDPKQKVTDVHVPGSRPVRFGDAGTDVTALREFLGVRPAADWFGDGCETAVKRYQRMRGFKQDGLCGPITWAPIVRDLNL